MTYLADRLEILLDVYLSFAYIQQVQKKRLLSRMANNKKKREQIIRSCSQ